MTRTVIIRFLLAALLIGVAFAFAAWDKSTFSVRTTVENTAKATETGLARASMSSVQPFFADDARWLSKGELYD